MSKGPSEAAIRVALQQVDLSLYVFRPPDPKAGAGVSNWKPCDFMVWRRQDVPIKSDGSIVRWAESTWIEVKATTNVGVFSIDDLRPSQLAGIREAERMAIRYLLAIYWSRTRAWTISDAPAVLRWVDEERERRAAAGLPPLTSIDKAMLVSRFGVEATPAALVSVLKAALLGELDVA